MRVLSIGEILWDLFDDEERLGGAPLNVAVHAVLLGHEAAILSTVGKDDRGSRAIEGLREAGVLDRFVGRTNVAPTGVASVAVDEAGVPAFSIPRPAAYDFPTAGRVVIEAVAAWLPDWIVFGTLAQANPSMHELTERVIEACPRAERLYDVNLRPGLIADGLVRSLLALASVVKANEDEAIQLSGTGSQPAADSPPGVGARPVTSDGWAESFCRGIGERFGLRAVCITRGARGAALVLDGTYVEAAATQVDVVDTVGSGDAFSAALIHGIASGWRAADVADLATRVGSLVASRPGATPAWTIAEVTVGQANRGEIAGLTS